MKWHINHLCMGMRRWWRTAEGLRMFEHVTIAWPLKLEDKKKITRAQLEKK